MTYRVTKLESIFCRALRDDPSCQLCSILIKYVLKHEISTIEANLRLDQLPPLITLRQGIVVLARQWKGALYAPILIEYNLRSRGMKNLYSAHFDSGVPAASAGSVGDVDDAEGEDAGEDGEDEEDDDEEDDEVYN